MSLENAKGMEKLEVCERNGKVGRWGDMLSICYVWDVSGVLVNTNHTDIDLVQCFRRELGFEQFVVEVKGVDTTKKNRMNSMKIGLITEHWCIP